MSSQPLCFNIFGQLAAQPESAARVRCPSPSRGPSPCRSRGSMRFSSSMHLQLPGRRLGDKTSFDVRAIHAPGRGFLGVATKYTEPFSAPEYESEAYLQATNDPEGWFSSGAADIAKETSTNQLWRNCLLAQLTEQTDRL